VLLSWSEQVRVGLCPERLILLRLRHGLRPQVAEKKMLACAPADESEPWAPTVAALSEILKMSQWRDRPVTAILSSHFVRYLLVPWSEKLVSEAEWRAWVEHHFQRIFGTPRSGWALRWQKQGEKRPLIACALDQELLDSLEQAVRDAGGQLKAVQPYLMRGFHRCGAEMNLADQWWVLVEPGHITVSLLHRGHWTRLLSRAANGRWQDELPLWLERERALVANPEVGREVLVHSIDGPQVAMPRGEGWTFRWVNSPAATREDSGYSMVGL